MFWVSADTFREVCASVTNRSLAKLGSECWSTCCWLLQSAFDTKTMEIESRLGSIVVLYL